MPSDSDAPPPGFQLQARQVQALEGLRQEQILAGLEVVEPVALNTIALPGSTDHFHGTLHVKMEVRREGDSGATRSVEWLLDPGGEVIAAFDPDAEEHADAPE